MTEDVLDRYVCVHGHFYQPPRENPWLEIVEQQDSAYPHHDWNERITAESYGPNTHARVLDDQGRIIRLVNNYARMSFNIGPTLLHWMADNAPDVYADILEADRRSAARFGGHGSAMAQVYNHVIMPLANRRDRRTQILWGLRDFRHRFGRDPEGMWLAETAADDDTLDLLAEHGIRFTVLSPFQAARVRAPGETRWRDVSGGAVDPRRPYLRRLESGREIALFFYDGPISQAVAFEGLLESGPRFAQRLLSGFTDRDGPQLVNIATDGESYGHHHRHGEMALAAALQSLAERDDVELTNYGQYLELHPPEWEAEIIDPSSWSCAHGVERWRSDCGCSTGDDGFHQRWRGPLRDALDWLRDELATSYEQEASRLVRDPWAARDDYIDVVLERSDERHRTFLDRHARHELTGHELNHLLRLLEIQRQALLMYTSCGWFFDELSRIEPMQVLRYAARAIQLADDAFGVDLAEGFRERLAEARSNLPERGTGRDIYERSIEPNIARLETVGAHFAIAGLFRTYGEKERLGAYEVDRPDYHVHEAGRAKLAFGRVAVRSVVTRSERHLEFAVLHFGDHNFACGIRPLGGDDAYGAMRTALADRFATADFPEVIRAIDEHFDDHRYSLRDLFRDEQRRILREILEQTVEETEQAYRNIYRGRAPLMRFLSDLDAALPAPLHSAAEVVVNADLRRELSRTGVDPHHVASLIAEARRFGLILDDQGLSHALSENVRRQSRRIRDLLDEPSLFDDFEAQEERFLDRMAALVEVARSMPFEVDLADAQDVLWRVLRDSYPELSTRAARGDEAAARWVAELARIADELDVVVPG